MKRTPVVAVLGPTASGKSQLAQDLALAHQAELINGDASAVYRELSVGVTKPTASERKVVPHHLLDVTDLASGMTLVDYQGLARRAISEISSRDRLPIVVGGSGLYTRALLDGYLPPQIEVPEQLRLSCRALELEQALDRLHQVDPAAWERIDRKNPRRVVRALELALANQGPVAPATAVPDPSLRILRLYLLPSKDMLLERITRRTAAMWEGWLEEVDQLERMGLASWLEQRKPIGYGIVRAHLQGALDRAEASELIVKQTMALAKKQRTWLRKEDDSHEARRWHLEAPQDWDEMSQQALETVDEFLKAGPRD